MVKCVFCGRETPFHEGLHLITNEGSVKFYCSSKCRKNALKLKRDNRKVRWAEAFHIMRAKSAEKHKELSKKEEARKKEEKEHEKQSRKAKKEKKEEGKK
jgi:large subunit ribosomal protein L24e